MTLSIKVDLLLKEENERTSIFYSCQDSCFHAIMAIRLWRGPLDMKDVGYRPQSMSYWLRSASWGTERLPPSVYPQRPLLPRRVTTEALFRVSFKTTDDPYYQLLKTGIWVMAWDFIGILFLLLLIILQWVARPFLGVGGWGRGERSQSTPGALRQAASRACLPAAWTTVHVFPFPGRPVVSWMATTSGPGRGQGGSQWSPGAFTAPNQVNLISLLTKSFHESEQSQYWPNGRKERGQVKKKEYRPSDC